MSDNKYISSPRPFFEHKESDRERTLVFGTASSGITICFTKEGTIKINGYYEGFDNTEQKYACIRDFVELSREDLEEFWRSLKVKRKKEIVIKETPDKFDTPTQEYLDTLRKVTLNGMLFYIDPVRRERRPVSQPSQVFSFDKIFKR